MSRAGSGSETARPTGNGRLTEDELLSALPARSANREVRVGLFVLLGLVAFFTALFTMTDVGTFRGRYYLSTVVADAGGMRRGDPVQMRGVNIGRVVGFDMVPGGVDVKLELLNEYKVPQGSRALVKSNGLLGGMVVDVLPGSGRQAMKDGQTLPGGVEEGIFSEAAQLGTRADTVLGRVTELLSHQTIGSVGSSAAELQTLLAELSGMVAQERTQVAALTASLRRSAAGVEGAATAPELRRSVVRMDSVTARLAATAATLDRASGSLEEVMGRIERGEGTLGKLSRDEALYANLNSAASNLNQLVADIKANPKKYLNVSVF